MTQSNQSPQITYSLEDFLLRLEQKIDKRFENLENKLDGLQKQVNDFRTETSVALSDIKREIKTIDSRLENVEKTVDETKTDTKKNREDVADLKGAKSLIIPIVVAVLTSILTLLIRAIPNP